jgi:hypothetical protein
MDMQVSYDSHVPSPNGNVLAAGFKPLLTQSPQRQIHRNHSKALARILLQYSFIVAESLT